MTPQEYRKHDVDGTERTRTQTHGERLAASCLIEKASREYGRNKIAEVAKIHRHQVKKIEDMEIRMDSEAYRRLYYFVHGEVE